MAVKHVLFLDDMEPRHESFMRAISDTEPDAVVYQARTAAEAITYLDSVDIDHVFLDHDLSEEDIMSVVGRPTRVPTGMRVVDHIVSMGKKPGFATVHSMNGPAAAEMVRRLAEAGITSGYFPFSYLISILQR